MVGIVTVIVVQCSKYQRSRYNWHDPLDGCERIVTVQYLTRLHLILVLSNIVSTLQLFITFDHY